ncbi:hypothetical protein PAF17_16010 [Paracoccus sp. Z330]|uniref:Uncharacterized protein n=1 Tax=Paracoccus onchidii TaxID=3017813 RepID=A0ABT4ZIU5_9RHOB|nr:hypothetical protein [Paracoccus onchidii]MDB6178997.1 hypothetical protein [Paracoccus onchidii]
MNTQTDEDLKAAALPPRFTFDEIKDIFEDDELVRMADDGEVDLPDDFKRPQPREERQSAAQTIMAGAQPAEDDDQADNDQTGENEGKGDEGAPDGDGQSDADADASNKPEDEDDAKAEDKAGAEDDAMSKIPEPERDIRDASDHQKVIDEFDDRLTEINDAYDDGELTSAEMREKIKDLNKEYATAQREVGDIERHNERQEEEYRSAWFSKTDAFMQQHPEYAGKEKIDGVDGSAMEVFDQSLRFVTGNANYQSMTMDQKIREAAKIADAYVEQQTGKKLTDPAPKQDVGKDGGKAKEADTETIGDGPKRGPRPEAPRTLANVTTATDNEITDGRFAAVDRADGLEAEREISRMSEAEREAYLRGE